MVNQAQNVYNMSPVPEAMAVPCEYMLSIKR